jgi:hypothetical protein
MLLDINLKFRGFRRLFGRFHIGVRVLSERMR